LPPMKPATRYVAHAIPSIDKRAWVAQWAAPGMTPRFVLDGDQPQRFNTPGSAEVAAMRTMIEALNSRPRGTWKGKREYMSGAEMARLLAEAETGPADVSRLIGSRHDRVMEMLDGARQPPFFLWWALPLLKDQKIADWAFEVAMAHTDESREEVE
jgi:hypothetical protein